MEDAVRRWLREQLIRLVQVQRCTLGQFASMVGGSAREPDLVVQTWAGIVTFIHLLNEPIKPPKIRRILEQATGAGISTLFLVKGALLPPPGQRVTHDKWFLALQSLGHDQFYTYTLAEQGPVIRLVHFAAVTKQEVEAAYGPPRTIEYLRHYRHSARLNVIKGYWLVADFESDVRSKNESVRRPETTPPPPPNSASQEQPFRQEPPRDPPKTYLDACYELLGLTGASSREEVKSAFRRLAFAVHPDVSDLPKDEAEARFKVLNEAYEYIKTAKGWQ